MPTWLMNVAKAQEHCILGRYRKALDALARAEKADSSQSLVYYVRGDVYYYLALLSLLKQGNFTIHSETSEIYFTPDEGAKALLSLARDAYRHADMEVHTPAEIQLQNGTFVVPQISKQHQQQANSVLENDTSRIIVQEEEKGIVAIWVLRLFTDESKPAQEIRRITEKPH
jgi:hypothetical protein